VASRAAHPTTVLSDARLPIPERPEEIGDGGDGDGEGEEEGWRGWVWLWPRESTSSACPLLAGGLAI